jgi:dTDP-4-amino-4,6-dideoxygalactose transaminase
MADRKASSSKIARSMEVVPFFDLRAHVRALHSEVSAALDDVFTQASFILGPQVNEFEERFASLCGARYCVGVGSGTSALKLGLQALGAAPGTEVIMPANTYIASALAVSQVGASPVLVDIDPYYHMDITQVEAAITERTVAIMPVHLYGQAMPMQPLVELATAHGLHVIEDACQAHGALSDGRPVGGIGDLGCFSFYPSKNLGAYGDGGAIVTNDDALAESVRVARDLGQRRRYDHVIKGENSRLDTLQAAILLAKLPHLASWNDRRRQIACFYDRELTAIGVEPPARYSLQAHVYHLYVVELDYRDVVKDWLQGVGVATAVHYPKPIHRQQAYAKSDVASQTYARTEYSCDHLLSLPMYPELSDYNVEYVISSLRSAIDRCTRRPKAPSKAIRGE